MALAPISQRDQVKLFIGFAGIALAVLYWMYPYAAKDEQLALDESRITTIEEANRRAAREFAGGSIETLRSQAAENRSALTVMRRLVPTGNEVPALLEEVSTAARRAGLDVGGVVPEPVIVAIASIPIATPSRSSVVITSSANSSPTWVPCHVSWHR